MAGQVVEVTAHVDDASVSESRQALVVVRPFGSLARLTNHLRPPPF